MNEILDKRAEKVIKSLLDEDQARVRGYINLFQEHKFILSGKYLKKLKKNIWELRPGKIRILFGVINDTIFIVHVFKKKTQKTPRREIEIAEKRIKEYTI